MITISKDAVRAIETEGYTVIPNYSGRGMYGKTCFGIICANPIKAAMVITRILMMDYIDDGEMILDTMMNLACSDSMGLDTIIYFPRVSVDVDEGDDEDEVE